LFGQTLRQGQHRGVGLGQDALKSSVPRQRVDGSIDVIGTVMTGKPVRAGWIIG
jgi:hypothetical protein